MPLKGWRVAVIVVTVAAVLAILGSGQWLYYKFYLKEPLFAELASNQAILEVDYVKARPVDILEVKLGAVDNLKQTYDQLKAEIKKVRPTQELKLILDDNRNPYLENLDYQAQLAIYESIATGRYTQLQNQLELEFSQSGLDQWAVFVDQENVYLQLHLNDYYLYDVISRQGTQQPAYTLATAGPDGKGNK